VPEFEEKDLVNMILSPGSNNQNVVQNTYPLFREGEGRELVEYAQLDMDFDEGVVDFQFYFD
jgi:hypothetical protein